MTAYGRGEAEYQRQPRRFCLRQRNHFQSCTESYAGDSCSPGPVQRSHRCEWRIHYGDYFDLKRLDDL